MAARNIFSLYGCVANTIITVVVKETVSDTQGPARGTSLMRAIWSDWRDGVCSPTTCAVWAVASGLATVTGPFGTYASMSRLELATYWPLIIALSICFAYLVKGGVTHLVPGESQALRELCSGAFLTMGFAPVIWVLNTSVYGVPRDAVSFIEIASSVMLVALGISLIRFALGIETHRTKAEDGAPQAAEALPKFAARLSGWSGSPIVHLTVDDHYTEAHCLDGSHYRVLIRFADAVNEMEGTRGVCIHRSHWIALDHIEETMRQKGRDFVRLSTGAVLPVSRKYRPNLVEAGYLVLPGSRDAA